MFPFIKKWWHLLVLMHWRNFYRSAPSTTEDLEERAYRLEYWHESTGANWRILRLQWARLFAWRLTKEERWKQEATQMFAIMNHPMAGTRQLADWKLQGAQNPPPALKKSLNRLYEMSKIDFDVVDTDNP